MYTLHFLTDLHLGHVLCDEKLLGQDCQAIADDPLALWIGGGDYAEFINRSDKRHRESELAEWLHGEDDVVGIQVERILKHLVPIRNKCIGLIKGNHEDDNLTRYERDVYSAIVNRITDPNRQVRLGVSGFVNLYWYQNGKNRWTTAIFAHHGAGGGLLPGGHALTLGRLPTWYNFDIALVGHRHIKHWVPNTRTEPNLKGTGINKRAQVMVFGGTYLDSVAEGGETYAERKMLPPTGVGGVRIKLDPAKGQFKVLL